MNDESRMTNAEGARFALQEVRWIRLLFASFAMRRSSLIALLALGLAACSPAPASHPDDAAIRQLLSRYFETWSKQDMEGYGACFESEARVLFVGSDGKIVSEGMVDFLHGQKLAHARSATPMTERPLEMKIQGDRKVAQAAVTWVLSKGAAEERGTDFFTLRHDDAGWKIVSLVFYGE
jgi:hypothetical protein